MRENGRKQRARERTTRGSFDASRSSKERRNLELGVEPSHLTQTNRISVPGKRRSYRDHREEEARESEKAPPLLSMCRP